MNGAGGEKSIEHILPQRPARESQWLKDFPDPEQREVLTHGIGNLVLTRDNSEYGNRDYARKRGDRGSAERCYSSPKSLYREQELADHYHRWTPEEVESRRQAVEKWAMIRWHMVAPRSPVNEEVLVAEDGPSVDDD